MLKAKIVGKFELGGKVLIEDKKQYGYICDDTDCDAGHYIVDCYDFIESTDPVKYLIDVTEKDIVEVDE